MDTKKILAIIVAIISGGYLIPFAIALWQDHPSSLGIFLVNFLLGWTVIGWIAALIWALR